MILNLWELNNSSIQHFRMDTFENALIIISKNACIMASVDIKNAYFSVRIYKERQKYLRFI